MTVEFDNDIYTIDFTDPANGDFAIQPFTTNGPLSPTSVSLAPGATSAATTLTLVGRGLPGWGESVIENMVHLLENFAGPTEPTFQIPGQMWFDNATDTLKVRNQANTTWNPVLTVGTDLDFGGFKGINVADATDPTDAMNQQASDARYVQLTGDAMVGALSMSNNLINFVTDPVAPQDVATKNYADITFVDLAGDTMTGDLILNGAPTVALQAATKDYVDTEIISVGDARFINVLGDTMSGFLTLNADPTIAFHAATKQYVDSVAGGGAVDGVVDSGFFDAGANGGQITLTRTEGLPNILISSMNAHPHDASQVTYQAEQGQRLDNVAPEQFVTGYVQSFANFEFDRASQVIQSRNKRQFAVGTDFPGAVLTLNFAYPAETHRLEVFVNLLGAATGGRKLVADERGVTEIDLISTEGVFASSVTGLPDDATLFTFTINVDAGGVTPISIAGEDAQLYGENFSTASPKTGLIDAINAAFVGAGVPAIATFEEETILIFSDTTGGASSVVVVDTGLFAALTPERTILNFVGVTGATLPNSGPAAWFDVSSTGATYRMWFSRPAGPTTAPAAGGNVLTAIVFTGAETDQAISDLVVAALFAADGDFSLVDNLGGTTPLIDMTLSAVGAVPDVEDGLVPTGAVLFVQQQGVTTSISSIGGVTHDYSEDGPALVDSTSITLPGAPAGTDEFEVIRIK